MSSVPSLVAVVVADVVAVAIVVVDSYARLVAELVVVDLAPKWSTLLSSN